jgi:DNA-binding response OmpR family regulator
MNDKIKIMVVDDEYEICSMLKDFLEREGYEAFTATSVKDALGIIEKERPKVILLDIRMPEMNGIEAIEEIRKIDEKVGIIMATAVMDEDVARKAMELGASDYIIKPFDLEYLRKSLLIKLAMLT